MVGSKKRAPPAGGPEGLVGEKFWWLSQVASDHTLPPRCSQLAVMVCEHYGSAGCVNLSMGSMATMLGCSAANVRALLLKMESAGHVLVDWKDGGGRGVTHRIHPHLLEGKPPMLRGYLRRKPLEKSGTFRGSKLPNISGGLDDKNSQIFERKSPKNFDGKVPKKLGRKTVDEDREEDLPPDSPPGCQGGGDHVQQGETEEEFFPSDWADEEGEEEFYDEIPF
ncbi:SgrR family transcriptional regulator [Notoacmeibacter marinus]|uniref:SgrR family transcriptional regulator n=1 Tax=Notoacmeibacter marinus TaxID=1876515 RepID=UPI00117B4F2F|nr:SgrR family transcriptional regulator [Notoacmeibacter marinus]